MENNQDLARYIQESKSNRADIQRVDARHPGRPRKQMAVSREFSRTVFLNEEVDSKLRAIKAFQRLDYKDVAFAGIARFLEEHYVDGRLDAEGIEYVKKVNKA